MAVLVGCRIESCKVDLCDGIVRYLGFEAVGSNYEDLVAYDVNELARGFAVVTDATFQVDR